MKRFITIAILVTMTLHCASRLGVLSYLYENRHEIAYHAGLIAEIPIAMCTEDHFAKNGPLVIDEIESDSSEQVPLQVVTANEIILFFHSDRHPSSNVPLVSSQTHNTAWVNSIYDKPTIGIFHPPC